MNIYSNKRGWKIFLFVIAIVIVISTWWYTNRLLTKLAKEEKEKVEIWSNAITRKAGLVNYTKKLFETLQNQEKRYVEQWASALRHLVNAGENENISFYSEFVSQNTSIPVILVDQKGYITAKNNLSQEFDTISLFTPEKLKAFTSFSPIEVPYYQNQVIYIYYQNSNLFIRLKTTLDDLVEAFLNEVVENSISIPVIITDSLQHKIIASSETANIKNNIKKEELNSILNDYKFQHPVIEVDIPNMGTNYIFYKDSELMMQMKYFPFVQFAVMALFLIVAYALFSLSRRTEQNLVWIGLAKETAHQLGTPISALLAWTEILKIEKVDPSMVSQIEMDINRLSLVSERFSKIGSVPELKPQNMIELIQNTIDYMQPRYTQRISYSFKHSEKELVLMVNRDLFIWVLENIIKNSIDAIGSANGLIETEISFSGRNVYIDVTDNGKGIPKSKFKRIFEPGYTTKQRGWGLGLSLVKRIIKDYHKGKIVVKNSIPEKATTIRITLNKLKS